MKVVMRNIVELMLEYRNNPMRLMRAASVSTDGRGGLFSYGMQIARYLDDICVYYVLHDPDTSVTTSGHLHALKRYLSMRCIREVPWLTASNDEIRQYYASLLARIEQRYNRSKNLNTAREYFYMNSYYSRYTTDLPPVPAKIQLFAELENWCV